VILFLETSQTLLKHSIHLVDLFLYAKQNIVWERKRDVTYQCEFFLDLCLHLLTLLHYAHILVIHGFSMIDLLLVLDMRHVFASLRLRVIQYLNYLEISRKLSTKFPDGENSLSLSLSVSLLIVSVCVRVCMCCRLVSDRANIPYSHSRGAGGAG
jgi:hypothetical protein